MGIVWEEPLVALERKLSGKRYKKIAKRDAVDMDAAPTESGCQVCGAKSVHRRNMCKPCWRLDVQYAEERSARA